MVDVKNLKYKTIFVTKDGVEYDVSETVEGLTWDDDEGELAVRITLNCKNVVIDGYYMSWHVVPGCYIILLACINDVDTEIVRGRIFEWNPTENNSKNQLEIVAYCEVFFLQKSNDDKFFPSGTGTKDALMSIFNEWGIPVQEYNGPNISHSKKVYRNQPISEMVLDLLSDAKKHGAGSYLVRSNKGNISVIPRGSNADIYCFRQENVIVSNEKVSTTNMVTRVKVIGKENKEGRRPVEAIVDGDLQYGVFQQIVDKSEDESLADAKASAEEILAERGQPERTINTECIDVPAVRKGDIIHIFAGPLDGYYYVKSVQHDAVNLKMTMKLELALSTGEEGQAAQTKDFNKGDKVILNGSVYRDSYGNGRGQSFSGYQGTITIKVDVSRMCPYHIDNIGWVEPSSITGV